MLKIISILIPFLIFAEELEVQLPTLSQLKPVYMSQVHAESTPWDWRYVDELRSILEFDLNAGGFCTVGQKREELEELFSWSDLRGKFSLPPWRNEHFSFVFALQVLQNALSLIAFDIDHGSSKKYPDIALSGRIEEDRRLVHRLADALHKDLFGVEGIASLRLLYANRDVFSAERISEIWICDIDGANARQLTFEKGCCLSPGFLPRSAGSEQEFFYVSFQEGQSKIFHSTLSQKQGQLMVSLRGNQALPVISNQGTQMAFITDVAGRPDLFIQNLDPKGRILGKARQLYSCPRATQASPTFSPDGKRIAFVSDKDGPPRIYLLDVISPKETKRPHPRLITVKNRENTSPAWSPDGSKLAYCAKSDGVRQIWIYDFNTGEERQLTTGPETKENPAWACDNLHLIYNTESEESCELYLINLHQPEPLLLSKGDGQKRFPCCESRQ